MTLRASRVASNSAPSPTRRRALRFGAVMAAAPFLAVPRRTRAAGVRTLAFRHAHTGEALTVAYASGDRYADDALARLDWFLRDFRTNDAHAIDPRLLDLLHDVAGTTGSRAPFEVVSAYRSPATNAALQRTGGGVATHSLHLEGRAIDVRLADVALADLRDAALSLRAGGVGFYPQSRFVHLDTGRVRRW
jgi:uncharacterized protein YcbK (DUF882 family)